MVNATTAAGSGLPPGNGLAPEDFATRYHLDALQRRGALGQGETIGIVTFAAIDPTVPLTFWNTYLGLNEPASRLSIVPVDGGSPGPSAVAGSDETDLDVEQSGAIAPAANVRVYEAPNTDPGFADAFFQAASDNVADTVSVSWGESQNYIAEQAAEGLETPSLAATYDEAFLELGAQGQSAFTSTGDEGAYVDLPDAMTTNIDTDVPADSPYITAAGGTTLPGPLEFLGFDANGVPTGGTELATIPSERAWSWDYLFPFCTELAFPAEDGSCALALAAGDTGGYSNEEPRPPYQQGISAFHDRNYLIPSGYQQVAPGLTLATTSILDPTPTLQSGWAATGRGTPDLSTDADPDTGYAVYDPVIFAAYGGFVEYGGTSFVAPQLNAATAVIDSALGHRVGFWNPKIYGYAGSNHSPFTPLNDTRAYSGKQYLSVTSPTGVTTAAAGQISNNNLYYTGQPGRDWNAATGLGIPDLAALAQDFSR